MAYKKIIKNHFQKSSNLISSLVSYEKKIELFAKEIFKLKKLNKKLLVAGNGGSCADAEHFVGELVCTYKKSDRKPFPAYLISSNEAAITAWSNDFSFETFIKRQVEALGNKGDILVCISTSGGNKISGGSMNLVHAAKAARKKGMKIISLIGKSGGELKKFSDIKFLINSSVTAYIQEAHMSILHSVCEVLEEMKK
jgi:phosphoheptose isomerase